MLPLFPEMTETEAIIYITFILFTAIISLITSIILIISTWKIFTKANQPGWAALIPLYNLYIYAKITFGNGWFFLFMFLPFINIIYGFIHLHKLSLSFGKNIGTTLGLIFLPYIFFPILAFSNSPYLGVARRIK